jgi:hypothetical protein
LNTVLRSQKPDSVFCSRTCRIASIEEEGMELPKGLALLNVRDLATMIEVSSMLSILGDHTEHRSGTSRTSRIPDASLHDLIADLLASASCACHPRCSHSPHTQNTATTFLSLPTGSRRPGISLRSTDIESRCILVR